MEEHDHARAKTSDHERDQYFLERVECFVLLKEMSWFFFFERVRFSLSIELRFFFRERVELFFLLSWQSCFLQKEERVGFSKVRIVFPRKSWVLSRESVFHGVLRELSYFYHDQHLLHCFPNIIFWFIAYLSFLLERIQIFLERELFFVILKEMSFSLEGWFFSSFEIVCFFVLFLAKENCFLSSAMRKLSCFFFLRVLRFLCGASLVFVHLRELVFSSLERVELFPVRKLRCFCFLFGESCFFLFIEREKKESWALILRGFIVLVERESWVFISEGVEFLSCTESNFRARIVFSCLGDWSFFFASRRVEKVEIFLFWLETFFSFLSELGFREFRFFFFLNKLSFPSMDCLFLWGCWYFSASDRFIDYLIDSFFLWENWFFFSVFSDLMFFLSSESWVFSLSWEGWAVFLFFLRELFLFFTERDARERCVSIRKLTLFLEWGIFSLFSERDQFFFLKKKKNNIITVFFFLFLFCANFCPSSWKRANFSWEGGVFLFSWTWWVFSWGVELFCFLRDREIWVFSWERRELDGLGFSLEWVGFSRERVEIIPFLETVEFFFYWGCFFFRLYWEFSFSFLIERRVAFSFSWDRFSSSWELSCFSSERVLIFQLGDFEFFFSERDDLSLKVAFWSSLEGHFLRPSGHKINFTKLENYASRACCGPLPIKKKKKTWKTITKILTNFEKYEK